MSNDAPTAAQPAPTDATVKAERARRLRKLTWLWFAIATLIVIGCVVLTSRTATIEAMKADFDERRKHEIVLCLAAMHGDLSPEACFCEATRQLSSRIDQDYSIADYPGPARMVLAKMIEEDLDRSCKHRG